MDVEEIEKQAVRPVPVSECVIGCRRWFLSWLPGHCSYCGRRYKRVIGFGPFFMVARGKACPNGHEGKVRTFSPFEGYGVERFDYVRDGDPGPFFNNA